MNRLIQDLLDVTRLEAGALSLTLEPVAPEQLVIEALEMQEPLAAAARCKLRHEVAAGLPAVLADRSRMLQLFQNLIDNALKFTPAGGQITFGATVKDRAVEFHVSDTGVGIPAEHLKNLFERLWQADRGWMRGHQLSIAAPLGPLWNEKGCAHPSHRPHDPDQGPCNHKCQRRSSSPAPRSPTTDSPLYTSPYV